MLQMKLQERIEQVDSKEALEQFVEALRLDLLSNEKDWENPTLERFLFAMECWIASMDNYYRNTGQQPPSSTSWKTFADILYASKIYE
jgi:glycyl-tRNA synthetase alpha subunit